MNTHLNTPRAAATEREQDPRRLLFVVTHMDRGGAETQILRISEHLVQRGWHVEVISLLPATGYIEQLTAAGVRLHDLGMGQGLSDVRAVRRCRRIIDEMRPGVVCAFLFHATALTTAAVALMRRRPVVVSSIRDSSLGGRRRIWATWLLDRARRLDLSVANSRLVAQSFARQRIVAADRMRWIPNGIPISDPEPVDATVRQELALEEDDFFWLAVGHIRAHKDYPNILDAFARLHATHPNARLRIVGKGVPPPEVANRLERLSGAVALLGPRKDVPRLMSACDAFVLGSWAEGLPNVVMEAMHAGRPVVATDVGGVAELVQHGESGFVVPARDARALADAMQQVMARPREERDALGRQGERWLREHFEIGRVVDQWEALFLELLDRHADR